MTDSHKNLWAPWRMEYIHSLGDGSNDECFLCRTRTQTEQDAENLVLWRSSAVLVLLNRFPYASGHTLIAPSTHVASLDECDDAVLLELMQSTRDVRRVLETSLQAQGFNIGINLGRCAGAGLPGHLHIHVVPRWAGDTNFMAVLGDATVMPQSLVEVRRLFLDAAAKLRLFSGC